MHMVVPLPTSERSVPGRRTPRKAINHGQSKTGTFTQRLGCKERIKGTFDDAGLHAGAGVGYAQGYVLAGREGRAASRHVRPAIYWLSPGSKRPPFGAIASRALMHRFSRAFSSCEESTLVTHRPPAPTTSNSTVGRPCGGSGLPCH